MKKGALVVLGIVKIILGVILMGLGSAVGVITIFLGIIWIIVALAQKPTGTNTKISDVHIDGPTSNSKEDSNQEVY